MATTVASTLGAAVFGAMSSFLGRRRNDGPVPRSGTAIALEKADEETAHLREAAETIDDEEVSEVARSPKTALPLEWKLQDRRRKLVHVQNVSAYPKK